MKICHDVTGSCCSLTLTIASAAAVLGCLLDTTLPTSCAWPGKPDIWRTDTQLLSDQSFTAQGHKAIYRKAIRLREANAVFTFMYPRFVTCQLTRINQNINIPVWSRATMQDVLCEVL